MLFIYLFIYLNQQGYLCCCFIGKFGHFLLLLILDAQIVLDLGILLLAFFVVVVLLSSLLSVITSLPF